jgi:hypothetical protein
MVRPFPGLVDVGLSGGAVFGRYCALLLPNALAWFDEVILHGVELGTERLDLATSDQFQIRARPMRGVTGLRRPGWLPGGADNQTRRLPWRIYLTHRRAFAVAPQKQDWDGVWPPWR